MTTTEDTTRSELINKLIEKTIAAEIKVNVLKQKDIPERVSEISNILNKRKTEQLKLSQITLSRPQKAIAQFR